MFKMLNSISGGVLTFLGVIGAALLALYGVLSSQTAPRQMALNDALRTLMEELQEDRSAWVARASEAERLCRSYEERVRVLAGEIRNLKQYNESMLRLLTKHGITFIPSDSLLESKNDGEVDVRGKDWSAV